MSVLKRISKWVIASTLLIIMLGIVYTIYCWSYCKCIDANVYRMLASDRKSIIAVFKPNIKDLPKIRIDRFLFKESFKYPFYSPQYYSDNFRINIPFNDSLLFVMDEKDTVKWVELYLIDTVPSVIKGYNNSGRLIVTYFQDTLFKSNIEHKPRVSILKQITPGPASLDCLDKKCN